MHPDGSDRFRTSYRQFLDSGILQGRLQRLSDMLVDLLIKGCEGVQSAVVEYSSWETGDLAEQTSSLQVSEEDDGVAEASDALRLRMLR